MHAFGFGIMWRSRICEEYLEALFYNSFKPSIVVGYEALMFFHSLLVFEVLMHVRLMLFSC